MNREWPKFLTTLSLKLFSICGCNSDQNSTETRMDGTLCDASNTIESYKNLCDVATHFDDVIAPPMDSLRETISSNV